MKAAVVLHPAGFVETGGCDGPRYVREQPSRETPGITLQDVSEKYIKDFNVPFRNTARLLRSLQINWDKLSDQDRNQVFKLVGPFNEQAQKNAQQAQQALGNLRLGALQNSSGLSDPTGILDTLNKIENSDPSLNYTSDQLASIKSEIDTWVIKKNWYLLLIIGILVLVIIGLLVRPGTLIKA
jgi:hypothetical protein